MAVKPPDYNAKVCKVGNWKWAIKMFIKKHQPTLPNQKKLICSQDLVLFIEEQLIANVGTINPV